MSEDNVNLLWKYCSNLESINIRDLRMFNPHRASPFKNISTRLRYFRLGFPRDGAEIRDDVEKGLFEELSRLPTLVSVELLKFSCHAPIVAEFPAVHDKILTISFQCKTNRQLLAVARVLNQLKALENLSLEFPQPRSRERRDQLFEEDVALPPHVDFPFNGQSLRIRGDASSKVFGFMIHPPFALRSLDVGMETLGPALLQREVLIMPGISNLEELILQANYPEHEDQIGLVLTRATSLKKLYILVADQTGWSYRGAHEYLQEHEARGVAEGPKTFDFVADFVQKSSTVEEVALSIATPLPFQLNENKFSVTDIKERLLQIKGEAQGSKLRCITVSVARINENPWKMQIIKDCLGIWRHHLLIV